MFNKSALVLAAFVTIAASVTASAAVSVAATPIAKTVAATSIITPVNNSPTLKVIRYIPASLSWTCTNVGSGEYSCTDPKTGNTYMCTNADSSGGRYCEVGDDNIPGSTK